MIAKQEKNVHRKKLGRPPGKTYRETIPVRLTPQAVAAVERWARANGASRSEAIRRLLEIGLKTTGEHEPSTPTRAAPHRAAEAASDLAARTVDKLTDDTAPVEEQAKRKRKLIKGPLEFRDIRKDQSSVKREPHTKKRKR